MYKNREIVFGFGYQQRPNTHLGVFKLDLRKLQTNYFSVTINVGRTAGGESQLFADDSCLQFVPKVIADCTIRDTIAHLYSPLL